MKNYSATGPQFKQSSNFKFVKVVVSFIFQDKFCLVIKSSVATQNFSWSQLNKV